MSETSRNDDRDRWTYEPDIWLNLRVSFLADPSECHRQASAYDSMGQTLSDPTARQLAAALGRALHALGFELDLEYDQIVDNFSASGALDE